MTDKKAPKKFLRRDTHKKKRIPLKWKKPRGIQNKMRLHKKGRPPTVKPGYGTDRDKRNTTRQGLEIVLVMNIEALKKIDAKAQAALLGQMGKRKKLEAIKEAEKLGITLANFNKKTYTEKIEKEKEEKNKTAKQREERKAEKIELAKKAEKEKKKEDEKEKEKEPTEEEKKKQEKEERDKILTTKS